MESSFKKIINALILFVFLLVLAGAFIVQQRNYITHLYIGKTAEPLNIVFLSEPALIMTYTPGTKFINITNAYLPPPKKTKNPPPELTPQEKALKLLGTKNIAPRHFKYFVPETESDAFWSDFKTTMSSWRYNPLLGVKYVYDYAKAYARHRTNIAPYEFVLLTLGSLNLEMTDFTVTVDMPQPKNSRAKPTDDKAGNSPLTVENHPLIVEIYNASGRKGAALQLTQYLRKLNEQKLLNIDVLQYDTNPKMEDNTKIIDNTGRSKELKQLSLALGLRDSELFSEKNPSAFCDAQIIIGKNFKMPK
ncbi:MAG: LytR C-terminal domain-containing protein [Elusimicrobia bacterium]|nr:LytR C-terminal domain-containing protein [Elusimicrobiota bacterium]